MTLVPINEGRPSIVYIKPQGRTDARDASPASQPGMGFRGVGREDGMRNGMQVKNLGDRAKDQRRISLTLCPELGA